VEYALTELGHSLRKQLFAFGRWAVSHDTNEWDRTETD
jgi:DNA-binding HxlR family transcriptional regulator